MASKRTSYVQAWADVCDMSYMGAIVRPDVIDDLVTWRLGDPRFFDHDGIKESVMQRQWTIEARADFADPEKNEAITEAIKRAAVHVHATMALISDGVKPQVVAFSDDFFTGHEEIALYEDKLGAAIAAHGADMGEAQVSDEMMQAVRDMSHDKNAK